MASTQQQPVEAPAAKRTRKGRGKAPIACNSAATDMDEEIWKKLPDDLIEPMLSRLPIPEFFRFRTVSQRWNSMLENGSFSQFCEKLPRAIPYIYTISYETVNAGSIYDLSVKKWRHPSTPDFPFETIIYPAASAGGLVCCSDFQNGNTYICNPLTKAWKELDTKSIRNWFNVAVGMTLNGDAASKGYKITWLGEEGEFNVYDSVKDTWLREGRMPKNITLPLSLPPLRSHTVSVGTVIHVLRSNPDGIVSYDTASGAWKESLIPLPADSNDHFLAEHGGKLFLVGLVRVRYTRQVWVWELQRMTLLWKVASKIPEPWCWIFNSRPLRMSCFGNTGLIMVALKSGQMMRLMMYDMAKREWSKVPSCILPGRKRRHWMTGGASFYPCLAAKP